MQAILLSFGILCAFTSCESEPDHSKDGIHYGKDGYYSQIGDQQLKLSRNDHQEGKWLDHIMPHPHINGETDRDRLRRESDEMMDRFNRDSGNRSSEGDRSGTGEKDNSHSDTSSHGGGGNTWC